ncbi:MULTISPECIES: hypothetical protein [unclassified Microcoleus]|uniref:hypothetical protein n=1 Tax=unclassified Microcoleus TaxID=2642155 RepID=UPI002FD07CF5
MAANDRAIAIKPENAEAWRARGAVVSELKQDTDKIDSGKCDITNASDSKVEQPKVSRFDVRTDYYIALFSN